MSLDTYTPTTELEAVNAILAASNEAPVTSLDATRPDVALAQAALIAAHREAMSARWRFNSDINYVLTGVSHAGGYVFPEPADLLAFTLTPTEDQRALDIVTRPSRTYLVSSQKVRILANRIGGVDQLSISTLHINPVWSVPFSLAPEAARRFIMRSAIRRRVQQSGLSKEQIETAASDEQSALASLQQTEAPQPPVQLSDGWASETDALNAILLSAQQQPVVDALAADGSALTALNILRQTVREVCAIGWRFNTETGYGIEPLPVVYSWDDVDGSVTDILVYEVPARLLSVAATKCSEQEGTRAIDPIIAKAARYVDVDDASPVVIYDRANHRDGFPQADRSILWLDVVWRKPFDEMPEVARHYATISAARQFAATAGVDPRWSSVDEQAAYRTLHQQERIRDRVNIFDRNAGVRAARGGRPRVSTLPYL